MRQTTRQLPSSCTAHITKQSNQKGRRRRFKWSLKIYSKRLKRAKIDLRSSKERVERRGEFRRNNNRTPLIFLSAILTGLYSSFALSLPSVEAPGYFWSPLSGLSNQPLSATARAS